MKNYLMNVMRISNIKGDKKYYKRYLHRSNCVALQLKKYSLLFHEFVILPPGS